MTSPRGPVRRARIGREAATTTRKDTRMAYYRKKPVVIEARHFALSTDAVSLADWCGGRVMYTATPCVLISTLEGDMRAEVGDYVIKGVKGEFYPCKPEIFEATYEPAEEPATA